VWTYRHNNDTPHKLCNIKWSIQNMHFIYTQCFKSYLLFLFVAAECNPSNLLVTVHQFSSEMCNSQIHVHTTFSTQITHPTIFWIFVDIEVGQSACGTHTHTNLYKCVKWAIHTYACNAYSNRFYLQLLCYNPPK